MFLFNLVVAGVCGVGIVTEFLLPEDKSSQPRLFFNAIFFGVNAYLAWSQL